MQVDDQCINCLFFHPELESLLQDTHRIKKKEFTVKILVDESCSDADASRDCVVEVNEFDERVTEEFLEIYFESKKSGGGKGTIKNISMTSQGKAFVSFHDPKGNNRFCEEEF